MLDDRQLAPERPVHPRTGVGGGARRRQVVADHVGNGGRGRSEQSERSPLRDKLLRSSEWPMQHTIIA